LQLLLDHPKIKLDWSDPVTERTALHIAVMKIGKMKTPPGEKNPFVLCLDRLLRSIIEIDARNTNDPESLRLIDAQDKYDNTALHLASKSGINQ